MMLFSAFDREPESYRIIRRKWVFSVHSSHGWIIGFVIHAGAIRPGQELLFDYGAEFFINQGGRPEDTNDDDDEI